MKEITKDEKIEKLVEMMLYNISIAGDLKNEHGNKYELTDFEEEYLMFRAILIDYDSDLCTPNEFSDDFNKEIEKYIADTYGKQ